MKGLATRLHHNVVSRALELLIRSASTTLNGAVKEPRNIWAPPLAVRDGDRPQSSRPEGLWPDLTWIHDNQRVIADVKTLSFSKSHFAGRDAGGSLGNAPLRVPGGSMEAYLALKHGCYMRSARGLDERWHGDTSGDGPVSRSLRDGTFGPRRKRRCGHDGERHQTSVHMLGIDPWGGGSHDTLDMLDTAAVSLCKAVCEGMSSEEASVHLSVVKDSLRRTFGVGVAREVARVRVDLAAELAAGRLIRIDEGEVPAITEPDHFDELPDESRGGRG